MSGILEANHRFVLLLYCLFSLLIGALVKYALPKTFGISTILIFVAAFAVILLFLLLCSYQPSFKDDVFQVSFCSCAGIFLKQNQMKGYFQIPLMPSVPCLSILINGILLLQLQPATWIRFILWSLVGN